MALWRSVRRPTPAAEQKDAVTRRHSAGPVYTFQGAPYAPPLGDLDLDRAVDQQWSRVIWVYRAIDARAKNAAGLTVRVNNGRGISATEIENHPLSILLNRQANPYETGKGFRYRLHTLLDLSKRGVFVEVICNRVGAPTQLHLLNPKHTFPIPNADKFVEGFEMRLPSGETFTLKPYKEGKGGVLWIRRPHPTDPYSSSTWLEAAGISVDLDHYARVYNKNFLLNDGKPGGIVAISSEEGIDDETAATIQARYAGGPDMAGRVSVVEADKLDWIDMATTPRDAQYVESRALTKGEILAAAGTPESLWNASGRTFDNADAELEGFWRNEMVNEVNMVASYYDMLTPGGIVDDSEVVTYAWEEISVLNRDEREQEARKASEFLNGTITLDEYRDATGKEPLDLPGSRVVWLTAGKAPVGDPDDVAAIMGQGAPPPEGEAPPGAPPEGEPPPEGGPEGEPPTGEDPVGDALLADDSDPVGDALLDQTKAVPGVKALPGVSGPPDPFGQQRAAQAALVDAWVDALSDEIATLFRRQEKVILTRLTGAKARKHTRHWVTKEGAPTRELKALDPEYIVDRRRWIDEVVTAISDVVRAAFTAAGATVLKWLGVDGTIEPDNEVIAKTVRVIAEGFDARAGRLQDVVREGDEAGKSIDEIADDIRQAFTAVDTWAEVTSRQVVGAMNAAQQIAATQAGAVKKRWLATDDERTRLTHREAEGQVVDIDDTFDVGEGSLLFPGDPTGPIGEWINCRCTCLFQTAERDFDAELDADLAELDAMEAALEGKGLIGRAASRITGAFGTLNVQFDPDAHPRDHRGRFVDTPDVILPDGSRGVAVSANDDGSVVVAKPTGAVVTLAPEKVSDPPKPQPKPARAPASFRPLTGGLVSANEAPEDDLVSPNVVTDTLRRAGGAVRDALTVDGDPLLSVTGDYTGNVDHTTPQPERPWSILSRQGLVSANMTADPATGSVYVYHGNLYLVPEPLTRAGSAAVTAFIEAQAPSDMGTMVDDDFDLVSANITDPGPVQVTPEPGATFDTFLGPAVVTDDGYRITINVDGRGPITLDITPPERWDNRQAGTAQILTTPSEVAAPVDAPDPESLVSANRVSGEQDMVNPGDTPYFGTGEQATFAERLGNCYELSTSALLYGAPEGSEVVYGTIQGDGNPPLGHAWVELPNGNIWEPISRTVSDPDEFTMQFSAIPHQTYTQDEARINLLKEMTYGPWYPVDERGIPLDGAPTPEERYEARAQAGRNLVAKITATPLVSPSVATVGVFHPADHPVDYQGRFDEAPLVRLPNGDVGIATAVDGSDMVTVIGPDGTELQVHADELTEVAEAGFRTDLLSPSVAPNDPVYRTPEGTYLLRNQVGSDEGSVVAIRQDTGEQVGELTWTRGPMSDGVISGVAVAEPYRRQGIASAMLDFAREQNPDDPIEHSDTLSPEGEAWSLVSPSVATDVVLEPVDGDPTRATFQSDGHTYTLIDHGRRVTAEEDGNHVGFLRWGTNGMIRMVQVNPEHQRRGVATAMLAFARQQHPEEHIIHGDEFTPEGRAWSLVSPNMAPQVTVDGDHNYIVQIGDQTVNVGKNPVAPLTEEEIEAGYDDGGLQWDPVAAARDLLSPNVEPIYTRPETVAKWNDTREYQSQWSTYILRNEGSGYVSAWLKPAKGNLDPHYRRVGLLSWNPTTGEISQIGVNESNRREGLATAMLAFAREIDPDVHHSDNLTEAGAAWALTSPNLSVMEGEGGLRETFAMIMEALFSIRAYYDDEPEGGEYRVIRTIPAGDRSLPIPERFRANRGDLVAALSAEGVQQVREQVKVSNEYLPDWDPNTTPAQIDAGNIVVTARQIPGRDGNNPTLKLTMGVQTDDGTVWEAPQAYIFPIPAELDDADAALLARQVAENNNLDVTLRFIPGPEPVATSVSEEARRNIPTMEELIDSGMTPNEAMTEWSEQMRAEKARILTERATALRDDDGAIRRDVISGLVDDTSGVIAADVESPTPVALYGVDSVTVSRLTEQGLQVGPGAVPDYEGGFATWAVQASRIPEGKVVPVRNVTIQGVPVEYGYATVRDGMPMLVEVPLREGAPAERLGIAEARFGYLKGAFDDATHSSNAAEAAVTGLAWTTTDLTGDPFGFAKTLATGGDGTITFWNHWPEVRTMRHETAHNIDNYARRVGDPPHIQSPEWREALTADEVAFGDFRASTHPASRNETNSESRTDHYLAYNPPTAGEGPGPSPYGRTSETEDFAESAAFYLKDRRYGHLGTAEIHPSRIPGGNVGPEVHFGFADLYPFRARYLDQVYGLDLAPLSEYARYRRMMLRTNLGPVTEWPRTHLEAELRRLGINPTGMTPEQMVAAIGDIPDPGGTDG